MAGVLSCEYRRINDNFRISPYCLKSQLVGNVEISHNACPVSGMFAAQHTHQLR
jgi:hypothetical protein